MKGKCVKGLLGVLLAVAMVIMVVLPSQAAMVKNVILMISDGQGYNTVEATAYYTGNPAVYESFPVQLGCSTYSAGDAWPDNNQFQEGEGGYDSTAAWDDFTHVKSGYTDSAAAATALATGVKTYDGGLGVDVFGEDLYNIVQIASDYDKATGVVSSVELSHATPAGMVAHNLSRNNYADIAVEMYGSELDVILGCGNPDFDNNGDEVAPGTLSYKYVGGEEVWAQLQDPDDDVYDEWTLIQSKDDFLDLANGDFDLTTDKLLGVPEVYQTLQYNRDAGTDFIDTVPDLATMSLGALEVLSQDDDGFFVMIEGGAVDWANHANDLTRMLEEQMDFDAAVAAVVDWVEENSSWNETLLIVTADHECGHLWGTGSAAAQDFLPVVDNGVGNLPGAEYNSGSHTNALVPVYAKGRGAWSLNFYADETDPVRGKYLDNTEIFQTMLGNRPWKTRAYSYTFEYGDNGDSYTGTVYAPLSKGYFTGQKIDMGVNETGAEGYYVITQMDYKPSSFAKMGRVYVDNYYNSEDDTDYTPTRVRSSKGWFYLGSEGGFIKRNWVPSYFFGFGYYEADANKFF